MDLLKISPYFIILYVLGVSLFLQLVFVLFTRFERVITVKSKEGYGMRKGQQLIMDTEGHVYSIHNTIWLMHFTSAEVFSSIEVGQRYKVSGYGVRVPVFGAFPNITKVERA